MENLGFVCIPAIAAICYVVAEIVKATKLNKKWLPIICMIAGGVLGVVAMKVITDYPATDILTAIAVGISSGLTATGIHQIGSQLKNN